MNISAIQNTIMVNVLLSYMTIWGICLILEFRGPALSRALRMRQEIEKALSVCGFAEIRIDPEGYRRGAMNKL